MANLLLDRPVSSQLISIGSLKGRTLDLPESLNALAIAVYFDGARRPAARLSTSQLAAALTVVDELNDDLAVALLARWDHPFARRAGPAHPLDAGRRVVGRADRSAPVMALRWVDPARTVVRAAFRDQHPELARRLNEVASDWEAAHGTPDRALRHAVTAGPGRAWSASSSRMANTALPLPGNADPRSAGGTARPSHRARSPPR